MFIVVLLLSIVPINGIVGREFREMMQALVNMNKEILNQRSNMKMTMRTEVTTEKHVQSMESGPNILTMTSENKDIDTESKVQDKLTMMSSQPTESKTTNTAHLQTNYQSTNAALFNSASHSNEIGESKQIPIDHTNDKRQRDVLQLLVYFGVSGGFLLAVILIAAFVIIRRRFKNKDISRFSVTDQKSYQNTSIFVMGQTEKSNDLIQSVNALPNDQVLWKELQCQSANVF